MNLEIVAGRNIVAEQGDRCGRNLVLKWFREIHPAWMDLYVLISVCPAADEGDMVHQGICLSVE